MIKLHGLNPIWGLADVSPFVTKLDCYLRLAKLQYEYVPCPKFWNINAAPQHKVPYITDEDGTILGDSGKCIAHLEKRVGMDAHLTAEQRAVGTAVQRMAEKSLNLVTYHIRWLRQIDVYVKELMAATGCSKQEVGVVLMSFREAVEKWEYIDGMSRHPPEFSDSIGMADLTSMSVLLGNKPWLFGDKPTSYDAVMFSFTAHALVPPFESPVRNHLRSLENLVAYVQRIQKSHF